MVVDANFSLQRRSITRLRALIVPHRDAFRSFNPLGPGYLRDSNELPRDVLFRDQMIA